MNDDSPNAILRYYGISPWEMEVIYGLLNSKFRVTQEETEQYDSDFVSVLIIILPIQFSEEFFKWFGFRAWDKIKSILKEMKRRRGKGNAITIEIAFTGEPNVRFITNLKEPHIFNSAIEKIDFMIELLPYHLNENDIPKNLSEVVYKFNPDIGKWQLNILITEDKKFICTEKGWKIIT